MAAMPKDQARLTRAQVDDMEGVLRNRKKTLETINDMVAKITDTRDAEIAGIALLEYQIRIGEAVLERQTGGN